MDIDKLLESKRPKVADLKEAIVELRKSADSRGVSDSNIIDSLKTRNSELIQTIDSKKEIIDNLSNQIYCINSQYQKLLKENDELKIRNRAKIAIYLFILVLSILFNLAFAL